jgi:hypothetical protein
MKWLFAVLAALLVSVPAHAQRTYSQGELDALLAPVALQPDGVLSQVLMAATYPDEVAAAARWSRANPQLRGDQAVRAADPEPWDPSVKALVAFPDLLARMEESPQWLRELGEAFLQQQAQVMDTVQSLRQRARANGQLNTTEQTAVYQQDNAIVIEPRSQIVYVPYYDPYVVYGSWWWPHYRPVFWRPWVVRPAFVSVGFFYGKPDWHHRHVHVVHRPVHVHSHHQHVAPGKWQHRPAITRPLGQAVTQHRSAVPRAPSVREYHRVPESQRKPIVQQHMPAANGFSNRQDHRREQRAEPRREQRQESSRPRFGGGEQRGHQRGNQGGNHGGNQGRGGGRG